MTRDLLLLCSGSAKKAGEGSDHAHPLRNKGKRQAQRIGVWLARHGLRPDHVISAPPERSVVTAEKALKAGGWGARGIQVAEAGLDGPDAALKVVAGHAGGAERPMIVADPALIHPLTAHLSGGRDCPSELGNGVLVHLDLAKETKDLQHGCARVRQIVQPGDLPKLFPFPGPDGAFERERPAYYYSQSAVIPYRQTASGVEVMIISSSKRNHWVVPKGIHEPGLTKQESAAEEAEEEAGIEGIVGDTPIGSYEYEKWEATCRVEVFPMQVTHVIAEADWQESHRARRWVSPQEASRALHQPELASMVTAFAGGSR
ncbi:NUDIX domain-containing protein [Rhodobacteraceae bacterium NNCM2]|nr:NUDIX domain-containing protein [Coraliihabitans acroporae]